MAVLTATALLSSGCGFKGLNSLVLPGAKGSGGAGYQLTVELPTAANLVPNSEVKVNDVTVGTVRSIGLDRWHAVAEVSVENNIVLPSGTTARVGQKSLLGAEYLELEAPRGGGTKGGRLQDGDTIPLKQAGAYPETEEVLSALASWLNGSGIENLNTIVRELADTLGPSAAQTKALLTNLRELTTTVNGQRRQLLELIDASDRLGVNVNKQTRRIGTALDNLSTGIAAVSDETPALTRALTSLDTLSSLGSRVLRRDAGNLTSDIKSLSSVLTEVNAAGQGLPDSLDLIGTVLFPISRVPYVVKGDYLNFAATVDLTLPSLQKGFLPGGTQAQTIDLLRTLLGLKAPAAPNTPRGTPGSTTPGKAGSNPLNTLLGGVLGNGKPGATDTGKPPTLGGLLGGLLGGGS